LRDVHIATISDVSSTVDTAWFQHRPSRCCKLLTGSISRCQPVIIVAYRFFVKPLQAVTFTAWSGLLQNMVTLTQYKPKTYT